MELVKETGSKVTISANGKRTSRKWGLFLCPSCGTTKEYTLQKGVKNKTCGAAGCRSTKADFRPWNANVKEEDKLNNLPYYSTFASRYRAIISNPLYIITWKSLEEFRDDMYNDYAKLRDSGVGRVNFCIYSDAPLSKSNCGWVEASKSIIEPTEVVINGKWHTAHLPDELHIPSEDLDRLVLSMFPSKVKEILYGVNGSVVSSPNYYYTFTDEEYTSVRAAIRDLQVISSDNYLYMIQMRDTDFVKIGRATNLDNRVADFNVGNPYELDVIFSIKIGNLGKIEQRVHKYVSHLAVKGEWFKLSEEDVYKTISFIKDIIDNP